MRGRETAPFFPTMLLSELETDRLRRCINCGGKMIHGTLESDLRKHLGHRLTLPQDVHLWEFIRIKLGWL